MPRDQWTLFLDTNSLLHYPPISNVDWLKLCDAGRVKLVLCMQVIHELDDKKSDPNLSERARRVIKEIEKAGSQDKSVRDGVSLDVFSHELRREEFANALSPDSKDDRIVHLVKKYKEKSCESAIAVYSEDSGMALRCKTYGTEVVKPDPDTRLPDPQTELDRKYKAAVIEMEALKNRIPKLEVRVCKPGDEPGPPEPFIVELSRNYERLDIEVAAREERKRLQLTDPRQSLTVHQAHLVPLLDYHWMTSKEDRDKYDEELGQYLMHYREWVENENAVADTRARRVEFDVQIAGTGSCPAEDVDVQIDFPPKFQALCSVGETLGQVPTSEPKPTPPKRPRNRILGFLELPIMQETNLFSFPTLPHRSLSPPARDWSVDPGGDECQGFHIRIHVGRIKHHKSFSAGPFNAIFRSWEDAGSFQGTGQVTAGNMPDMMDYRFDCVVDVEGP